LAETRSDTQRADAAAAALTPFPVNSVFMAVVSTNPATLLGYGTWSQMATGTLLVGITITEVVWVWKRTA